MNKRIYIIILLLTCGICNAQNLVPNGDFEQFSSCPTTPSQLNKVVSWMNPSLGTPDYFNQCTIDTMIDVPKNYFGFQQAHSGVGYIGCYVYYKTNPDYREFAEVGLQSPLVAGTTYHFEMYVNLSDICQYTLSDFGAYFSDISVWIPDDIPLPFTPQITNTSGALFDTLNWTLVSGDYIASGGENYLMIGNFNYDINTDTILFNNSQPPIAYYVSYVYIDDVSLTAVTGQTEYYANENVSIFPNPFSDNLTITAKTNQLSSITLYDLTSRILLQQSFTTSTTINTSQLASGIYLFQVRDNKGVIKNGKVVKD